MHFVVCWRVHHVMRHRTMFLLNFPTQFACAAKLVFGFVMQVLSFMTKTGATGRICPQSNHSFLVRSIVRVWSNTASAIQCLFLVLEISRFRGSKLGLLQSHTLTRNIVQQMSRMLYAKAVVLDWRRTHTHGSHTVFQPARTS